MAATLNTAPKEALAEYDAIVALHDRAWREAHRVGRFPTTSTTLMLVPDQLYETLVKLGARYNAARTECLRFAFT